VNLPGKHAFKRGDVVKMFFDTGAFGAQILFGLVIKAGSKVYTVVWESGIKNRLEQGRTIVALVEDPELLEEAHEGLRRAGLLGKLPSSLGKLS
jgi:hypothetical protein